MGGLLENAGLWADCNQGMRMGKLFLYPTETTYALGCMAGNGFAVQKLKYLKGREASKFFPVIVADEEMLATLNPCIEPLHRRLMEAFWPGPLTLVLKVDCLLPEGLCNPQGELAVRVSSHPVARRLAQIAGGPVVSTSANISGLPPAVMVDQLPLHLREQVDFVLDGGNLHGGASTLVRLEDDSLTLAVLREGAVPVEEIVQVLSNAWDVARHQDRLRCTPRPR